MQKRKAQHDLLQIILHEVGQEKYLQLKEEGRELYRTYESESMQPSQFWRMYAIHWFKAHVDYQWSNQTICFNHLARPKPGNFETRRPNQGYCPSCLPDPDNNQHCSGYKPVELRLQEVVIK